LNPTKRVRIPEIPLSLNRICYNGAVVTVSRLSGPHRAIAFFLCAIALAGAACLDVKSPAADGSPTPTATATLIPTSTPLPEATATATSTVTPTFTASPTITPIPFPTPFGAGQAPLRFDPVTGEVISATGTAPAPVPAGPVIAPAPPPASPTWGCDGDERMEFVPPAPAVGEKLFIFVTAGRDRQFGLIIGPQLSGVQGSTVPGGGGLKKGWELTPSAPGLYYYQFYGGPYPEHLCVSALVEVIVGSGLAGVPTPTGTATPRPAPTPLPPPRPDH